MPVAACRRNRYRHSWADTEPWSGRSPRRKSQTGWECARPWRRGLRHYRPGSSPGTATPRSRQIHGTGHEEENGGWVSWHILAQGGAVFMESLREPSAGGGADEELRAGRHGAQKRRQAIAAGRKSIDKGLDCALLHILAVGAHAIGIELAYKAGGGFRIVMQILAKPCSAAELLFRDDGRYIDIAAVILQAPLADAVELLQQSAQWDRYGCGMRRRWAWWHAPSAVRARFAAWDLWCR